VTLLDPIIIKIDMMMPYIVMNIDFLLFRIRYTAVTSDNMSGVDRVEFWIGPYLQYTYKFTDPSGQQTAVWVLSPHPRINITITEKAYDLAGNMAWTYPDSTPMNRNQNQSSLSVQQINQNLQESQQQEPNTKTTSRGYNITLNGTMGNNSWYLSNVSLTIKGLQGNESVFYSMDNGYWQSFNSPITLCLDGNHPFTVVVIDQHGNVTLLNPIFIKIDKTPPTATLSEKFRLRNRWYGYWICFEYTVRTRDTTSGLDRVEFWDGSSLKYEQNLYHGTGQKVVTWLHHRRINGLTVVVYDLAGNIIQQGFSR
jgi:hypothetical protein